MRAAGAIRETEAEFQSWYIDTARLHGWRVAHFRPAKTEKGWRTAVEADGKGFFDLVLVKGMRVIFDELKVKPNKLSTEQMAWHEAFAAVVTSNPNVEVHVHYPEDRDEIVAMLRG